MRPCRALSGVHYVSIIERQLWTLFLSVRDVSYLLIYDDDDKRALVVLFAVGGMQLFVLVSDFSTDDLIRSTLDLTDALIQ